MALRVGSPVAGRLVGLAGVPDPVFAEAMVGPGTAIDPLPGPGEAAAPIAGSLVQPLIRWDPAVVASSGRSPVCPVVALDAPKDALSELREDGPVAPGDPPFVWS